MDNEKKYIKNFLKYSKEMDLLSAIDKAIAVDLLGESFIEKLGADQKEVISFAVIVNNYLKLSQLRQQLEFTAKK